LAISTKIDTIIFDMDGVITTEEKYWACARLTFWELVTRTLNLPLDYGDVLRSESAREAMISDDLIYALKGRAVNSNWDIAYVISCVYLANIPSAAALTATDVPSLLNAIRTTQSGPTDWPHMIDAFLANTASMSGRPLIEEAGRCLHKALNLPGDLSDLLCVDGLFWWYLHSRFQRFYHGEALTELGAPPLLDGTALPADQLDVTLRTLRELSYTLGIASGRPMDELNDALGHLNLLSYFDPTRFGTLDVVREVESKLGIGGLAKPHPLSLLYALYPQAEPAQLLDQSFAAQPRPNVLMVGDSTSDIIIAKAAGTRSVGVLTGVRGTPAKKERQALLIDTGCDAILDDVTYLPDWLRVQ
jgi:phosphoglycolate phosphatase-like HAD superfamily hydrolase